jgi:biofilm PGA synthesis N-glycosyltransferase PgaC
VVDEPVDGVGAVTGNPKIRNRNTLLAKIQVGEYATIVGMIKRAERILGKLYTVSGVCAAFRKKAVVSAGFWSNNMVTDDIDISWKLQLDFWDVRYESRALCWILVPETLRGLFTQRIRWAQGGNETLLKYRRCLLDYRDRRMWPIYFEYVASVAWSYMLAVTLLLYLLHFVVDLPPQFVVTSFFGGFSGVVLTVLCLLQMLVGLSFEAKDDHTANRSVLWVIWYPVAYWVINCLVTLVALPKALLKQKTALAVWESPDRGI